jgi:hypothetical protein
MRAPGHVLKRLPSKRWAIAHHMNAMTVFEDEDEASRHAEWDVDVTFDTARDFFSRLTAAPYRRWIEIGQGTHMVILEKNRWQAINSIIEFLSEDVATAVEA